MVDISDQKQEMTDSFRIFGGIFCPSFTQNKDQTQYQGNC